MLDAVLALRHMNAHHRFAAHAAQIDLPGCHLIGENGGGRGLRLRTSLINLAFERICTKL